MPPTAAPLAYLAVSGRPINEADANGRLFELSEKLFTFVERLARLPKDGEPYEGHPDGYGLCGETAIDTYHQLIDEARALIDIEDHTA